MAKVVFLRQRRRGGEGERAGEGYERRDMHVSGGITKNTPWVLVNSRGPNSLSGPQNASRGTLQFDGRPDKATHPADGMQVSHA